MRIEKYEAKDGSTKEKYWLEEGDVVTLKYSTPREVKLGKYMNYSIQVVHDGNEKFLNLTQGQAKAIKKMNLQNGDLSMKQVKCETYENEYGKHLGVKLM